jgi:CDP-paratose 2-epimerase
VYNIGPGQGNSVSIVEAFAAIEEISGKEMIYEYVEEPRSGDHICYISDLTTAQAQSCHRVAGANKVPHRSMAQA